MTNQKGLPKPIAKLEESGYCLLNKTNTEFIHQNWLITNDGYKMETALKNQIIIRCNDPPPKECKYNIY